MKAETPLDYKVIFCRSIINDQGEFILKHKSLRNFLQWKPSDRVYIDGSDVIHWTMLEPFGTLLQYPCGTKRFIKQ